MVCGGIVNDSPRKDDDYGTISLQTSVNGGLTMGSTSSSSKFLAANMAKGMSKLVRVTWRDMGESISVPLPPACLLPQSPPETWGSSTFAHLSWRCHPSGSCLVGDLSNLPCLPLRAHSINRGEGSPGPWEFSFGSWTHSNSVTTAFHWQSWRGTSYFKLGWGNATSV